MEDDILIKQRLSCARERAGISQRILGLKMGLEPSGASIRINRYENGKRTPAFTLVRNMAKVLNVPVSFFYEPDDTIARIIMAVGDMDEKKRMSLLLQLEKDGGSQGADNN